MDYYADPYIRPMNR